MARMGALGEDDGELKDLECKESSESERRGILKVFMEDLIEPTLLDSSTRNGIDISTEKEISDGDRYENTTSLSKWVRPVIYANGLAGGGDYVIRVEVISGANKDEVINDTVAVATGSTRIRKVANRSILVKAGETVAVYITGLAGDGSVNTSDELYAGIV